MTAEPIHELDRLAATARAPGAAAVADIAFSVIFVSAISLLRIANICVGRDSASPVTPDCTDRGTFPFTGGTIHKVIVDVTGDRYIDHEAQVAPGSRSTEPRRPS